MERKFREFFRCPVCLDAVSPDSVVANTGLYCTHAMCKTCMRTMLETEIGELNRVNFSCQDPNCKHHIHPDVVRRFLEIENPSLLSLWEAHSVRLALSTEKDDTVCVCPYEKCAWVSLSGPDISACPQITCQNCNNVFCALCGVGEGHPIGPYPCGTNHHPDDWKNVQSCPKCQILTFRYRGCYGLTCGRCGHHFSVNPAKPCPKLLKFFFTRGSSVLWMFLFWTCLVLSSPLTVPLISLFFPPFFVYIWYRDWMERIPVWLQKRQKFRLFAKRVGWMVIATPSVVFLSGILCILFALFLILVMPIAFFICKIFFRKVRFSGIAEELICELFNYIPPTVNSYETVLTA